MKGSLVTKQIKPDWFIGRAGKLVFFGRSREEVSSKYWAHMKTRAKPKVISIVAAQTAEKLIQLERQLLC